MKAMTQVLMGGLVAAVTLGSVAYGAVPCEQVTLPGVYQAKLGRIEKLVSVSEVSYLKGAYRIAEVQSLPGGLYQEVSPGLFDRNGHAYSMIALSERKGTCTLGWYNPDLADFEFNMILGQTENGDLILGGDFEEYEIGRMTRISK